ncbi:helix-turn-helix domain-containing protein [Neobacillus sp. D3-1R]|uniref:helix-turn-helix domain-containing protein n=1 Tax=Neobacillus sp. D3-1R TaxID=3445778 RepID=UPI003F9EED4D
MNTIGKQIVQMRTLRGWDVDQFANVVGLDTETVQNLEKGLLDPQLSILEKITNTLNCSFKIGDVSI